MRIRIRTKFQVAARLALFLIATLASSFVLGEAGDDLLSKGLALHNQGSYDQAIAYFENYIATYPQSQNRNRAELYAGHGYALRSNPLTPSDASKAAQHFNYILAQGPNAPFYREAMFHTARAAYQLEDYVQAKDLLTKFIQAYPKDAYVQYAYNYLGHCERTLGTYQNAIDYYDRALTEFPDSPLKWDNMLCKAGLVAALGRYQEAEQLLGQIASTMAIDTETAGKTARMLALVQLAEQKPDEALRTLETFVQKYQSDPVATALVQEAKLYEAYVYFTKAQFSQALTIVDEMARTAAALTPEAALLKVKLFIGLNQLDNAEAQLNAVANSTFGQTNQDVVASYRALIALGRARYDEVVNILLPALKISANSASSVSLGYYDQPSSTGALEPHDFVAGCGTLILAFASRYAVNQNQNDYVAQEAIFNATSDYASKHSAGLQLVVAAIDKRRKEALQKPISQGSEAILVGAPNTASAGVGSNSGFFSNPENANNFLTLGGQTQNPNQNNGFQPLQIQSIPQTTPNNASPDSNPMGYVPNQQQNQPAQSPFGFNPAQQQPQLPSGSNASSYPQTFDPNQPQNAQPNQTQVPNYQQQSPYLNGQPAQGAANPQQQYQQVAPNGQATSPNGVGTTAPNGAAPLDGTAQQNGTNAPNGTVQQNSANPNDANGTEAEENEEPLTPEKAEDVLKRARVFFTNHEYDKANELLLETTTTSENFWVDCPKQALQIYLLRGQVLLALGKRSEAQMTFEDVATYAPHTPEASLASCFLGLKADELGQREDAIKHLRDATTGRGDYPLIDVALYYLGFNEWERRNVEGAQLAFERLYTTYPSSAYWSHAVWALAQIKSDLGNDRDAEKLVNEALQRKPDSKIIDYLLFLKGEIALRKRDYIKAQTAFDLIVELYPNSYWRALAKNRLAAIPETVDDTETMEAIERNIQRQSAEPTRPAAPQTAQVQEPQQRRPEYYERDVLDGYQPKNNLGAASSNSASTSRSAAPAARQTEAKGSEPRPSRTSSKPSSSASKNVPNSESKTSGTPANSSTKKTK